jgi:D-glycero-D-manno-heptose 1,7-bisphosphate phosphatase
MQKIKVLFLDRDGTIIYDKLGDYIRTIEQANLIPNADDAIALAKRAGYKIAIVTNQAAIAKGIITEARVQEINTYMQSMLAPKHAEFDLCYYAPSHPASPNEKYDHLSAWRKPNTGMVEQAIRDFAAQGFEVDKSQSFFIGDKQVDVECGIRAGLRPILVLTGYGETEKCREKNTPPEFIADDIYAAVTKHILASENAASNSPTTTTSTPTSASASTIHA